MLVDPDSSEDAKIIILSDGNDKNITQTDDNLVIYGPGDFEASGVLIKGTRNDSETVYSIDTGEGRILLALSTSVTKLAGEEEYDAVVVKAVASVEEALLSALSAKLVVVYGDAANVPEIIRNNKTSKLNLKKKDELESNIVYLEKK